MIGYKSMRTNFEKMKHSVKFYHSYLIQVINIFLYKIYIQKRLLHQAISNNKKQKLGSVL
jgi:hypothetical protein